MKPGTYHIKVTLKGLNTQNRFPMSWTFKKTMKVSNVQAKSINERAIKKPVNHWLYATIGTGVLLLASLGTAMDFKASSTMKNDWQALRLVLIGVLGLAFDEHVYFYKSCKRYRL